MMKRLLRAAVLVAVVYGAFAAFLYFEQRSILYRPDMSAPDKSKYPLADVLQDIQVTTEDGLTLNAWYVPPSQPGKETIIYYHGNGSHYGERTWRARHYADKGYGVVIASYRGYGGNPGQPTEEGLYKDARAYFKWLREDKKLSAKDIILYGESLGSGVSIEMATQYDVKAVILEAPYTSILNIAKERYPFMPVGLLLKDRFLSIDKIAAVTEPLFIFHGRLDRLIPSHPAWTDII